MISCFRRGSRRAESSRVVFDVDPPPYRSSDRRQGGKPRRGATVLGRESDKDKVKDLLIRSDPEENLAVVPIVGIGGLGKTTLARCVYNDKEVERHFDLRVWFLMSESPDLSGLMREVIKTAGGGDGDGCEDDWSIPEEELQFAVVGRKLLLVLDDVWDDGVEDLIRFMGLLQGVAGGSRILVTTRSEGVVGALGGGATVHRLAGLSDAHCWQLFRQRAFGAVREETEGLEKIGMEIAERCHGVPLIAIAVGGILYFESDRSVWTNVRDSEVWELPEMAGQVLSTLKLSYDHLPPHLKRCFEYCSLLPKAYEIDREKLVELWAAEGFTATPPPDAAASPPEDVSDGYFDDLLRRSFFEEDEDHGYKRSYRMHDLFHDLARSIVGDEHWTAKAGSEGRVPKGCRRLALVCSFFSPAIAAAPAGSKRVETLLFLMANPMTDSAPRCAIKKIPQEIFTSLRNLRLLDLSSMNITELPGSIGKLFHLKHLNISETQIGTLPGSIGSLRILNSLNLRLCTNLQTLPPSIKNLPNLAVLNLDGCKALQELPAGLCSLRSLLHLDISGCLSLVRMPPGMGRLANLQTLPMFAVDEEKGCSIAELQHLNLRNEIYIKNLGNLRNPVAAARANLREKPWLRRLELDWNRAEKGYGEDGGNVLEVLQPHPHLEVLEINFYSGTALSPGWMAAAAIESALPNLVEITLGGFGRCKRLPPLGQLPLLKRLQLASLDATEQLGEDFYGGTGTFPALEEFVAGVMPVWEEWPSPSDGRVVFPRLATMKLILCTRLSTLPRLPALRSLVLMWDSGKLLSEESLGGAGLPCLKELYVCRCAGPSTTWDGLRHLTALEELAVESFEGPSLPQGVNHLSSSLRSLRVLACPRLAVLPEGLESSTSLQSLEIVDCSELTSLPERMQQLSQQQALTDDEGDLVWRK